MIGLALIGILVLLISWILICNTKTCRQRIKIIEAWKAGPASFDSAYADFQRVSYQTHLWHLVTLRDPRRLYGRATHLNNGWKI